MSENQLTQEEINQILQGQSFSNNDTEEQSDKDFHFESIEIDTLGEIGNISMGAAATALYSILGREVVITTPKVSITSMASLIDNHQIPYFVVNVEYTEGFLGNSLFILQLDDVKAITDIMMGGDGTNIMQEMDEIHVSAISEAMNQMMGAMATSMASMFDRIVNISPPKSTVINLSDSEVIKILSEKNDEMVRISFSLQIKGLIDSSIMQLLPLNFAQKIVTDLLNPGTGNTEKEQEKSPAAVRGSSTTQGPSKTREPAPSQPRQNVAASAVSGYEKTSMRPAPAQETTSVDARPIRLTSFDDYQDTREDNINEIGVDMILDVPLQAKVELGQCRKTIREVLDLNIGSVIALEKAAGEPVDLVVNGKAVAKGEVIVIEDNYGIRITEILSPSNRIKSR